MTDRRSRIDKLLPNRRTRVNELLSQGEDLRAQPSAGREFLSGVSGSWIDEIEAGASALLGPKVVAPGISGGPTLEQRYRPAVEQIRGAQAQFAEENPGTALGLNIAGGLTGGLATGGAGLATAGGKALAQAVTRLPWWQRLLAAAGLGAGSGGAGGALAGAGEAETVADIPAEAASGAATGAAVGGVLGPVGEAVATPVQWVKNRFSHAFSPEVRARSRVRQAIEEGGSTVEEAAQQVKESPGSILADVGEGPRAELEFTTQRPGTTPQQAEDFLRARAEGAGAEVQGLFGEGRKFQILEDLQAERAQSAAPLYQAAYTRETPMSPELERLWDLPTVRKFWGSREMREAAQEIADVEGLPFNPAMFETAQPSTMGWDYLVRGLDNAIEARRINNPSSAGRLKKLRGEIMDEVRRQNPTLGEARSVWAGTKQFEEAMELGRDFFNISPDAFEARFKGLTDVEREAYREGINQAVADKIASSGDVHSVTKFFKKRGMWPKVRALFDNDEEFSAFQTRINQLDEQQATFAQTRPRGGSRTHRTGARAEDFNLNLLSPMEGLRSIGGRMATLGVPGTEATRNRAGQFLLAGPEDIDEISRLLLTRPPVPATRGAGLFPVGAALPVAGGVVAAPNEQRR